MDIFRYIIPIDDGAAPNPYGGVCTLAICKANIRKIAKVGDWLIGLKNPTKELLYAMKVTSILSMKEYDEFTRKQLAIKIPDLSNKDVIYHMGDSVYDFSSKDVVLRKGVHSRCTKQIDLDGKNVLLSKHFYYLGDKPLKLSEIYIKNIDISIDFDYMDKNIFLNLQDFLDKNLELNKIYSKPNRIGIISPTNKQLQMSCCIRKKVEKQFL